MFDELAGEQKSLREKLYDFFVNRPSNPRSLKAFGLLFLIGIGSMFGVWIVTASPLFHSERVVSNANDPFTTLWNGQISNSYSTTVPSVGSIAFNNNVNATCAVSCGGSPIDTVLIFPSLTTQIGSTIIVEWYASHSIVATFTITDSSLNIYTTRLSVTSGSGLDVYFASASSSTSGSLVVTLKSSAQNAFAGVVSDYTGAIGFGNIASNVGSVGIGVLSGTSTITITSSATSSFILEFMAVSSSGGTGSVTASSSQTLRNPYSTAAGQSSASGAFDITGLSGSQSLSLHFVFTTDQSFFKHEGLELTNSVSAKTCGLVGYQCSNMKIVNGYLQAGSNVSFPAIALTNSSVDLSTGSSKAIAFNFGLVTNTPFVGEEFGWFLRTNGTLPRSSGWSPTNDTTTALAVIVTITANKVNYYVYMQRQTGQALFTGTETPTIPCSQASTIFLCANNSSNADSSFPILPIVLNYTGSANGSANAGLSYLCNDFGGGSTTCNLGGANNQAISITNTNFRINYTEPWLNLQNKYYVGLWQKATSNPALVKFQTATFNVQSGEVISIYSPSSTSSTIAEGGFFGWLGGALGNSFNVVGSILGPIISPITGLGNSLISALISGLIQVVSYFAQSLRTALNALGQFFGLGNLGDYIVLFFSGIVSWLVNVLGNAFVQITNIVNIFAPIVSFFTSLFGGPIWTGLVGLANLIASGWVTIITAYNLLTMLSTNGLLGLNYYFLVDWIFGMFMLSTKGIEGFKTWIDLNALVFGKLAMVVFFFVKESMQVLVWLKQLVVNWT